MTLFTIYEFVLGKLSETSMTLIPRSFAGLSSLRYAQASSKKLEKKEMDWMGKDVSIAVILNILSSIT